MKVDNCFIEKAHYNNQHSSSEMLELMDRVQSVGLQAIDQRQFIAEFLSQQAGNGQLNQRLKRLQHPTWAETFMLEWTHRTRVLRLVESAVEKLEGVHSASDLAMAVSAGEEAGLLTVPEFGALIEFGQHAPQLFASIKELGLEGRPELAQLKELHERTVFLHKLLAGEYQRVTRMVFEPGDLMFSFSDREAAYSNRPPHRMTRIMEPWVDGVRHVGIIAKDVFGNIKSSEVLGDYFSEHYNIAHLTGESFRIDVVSLLTEHGRQLAEFRYGEGWEQKLQQQYSTLHRRLHRRMVSKAPPYQFENVSLRWIGLGPRSRLTHRRCRRNDFEKYRRQFFEGSETQPKQVLCSQFVALSVAAAVLQLERDLGWETCPRNPAFRLPFGEHEDLHAMMPQRLLELLRSSGCLQHVPIPGPLGRLVQMDPV